MPHAADAVTRARPARPGQEQGGHHRDDSSGNADLAGDGLQPYLTAGPVQYQSAVRSYETWLDRTGPLWRLTTGTAQPRVR
jgi:hypothetical protein